MAGAKLPERLGLGLLRNRVIVRAMSIMMAKTRIRNCAPTSTPQHDAYFSAFANRRVVLEAFRASISADVAQVAGRLGPAGAPDRRRTRRHRFRAQPAQARAAIRGARLEVIPAVGHLIHYETRPRPAAYIRDFIDGMSA